MRENKKRLEAFDYYYELGEKRSLKAVAERFGIGKRTVETWSYSLDWKGKIEQREKELAAQLDADIIKRHKEFKLAQYEQTLKDIADLDKMRNYQKAVYNTSIGSDGKPKIKIETIRDMKDVVFALGSLLKDKNETIKMAQLLAGDNTEQIEHSGEQDINVTFHVVKPGDKSEE